MKKYFIIAIAAVTALAACSKNEVVKIDTPDTPIQFAVVNHLQQTKATAGLTYPTDVPFGTFAWWTSADWTGAAEDQDFVFMDNEQIVYRTLEETSAYAWAPATAYYWTKTGKITFASYSPYTADGTDKGYSEIPSYDVAKGFLFNNYTIVDATNVDLMYANLAANCNRNTNQDGAQVTDDNNPESGFNGVPTIFNHALCQIGFEFRAIGKKNPNVNAIKIEITDVDIKNIDNKGSFTQIPVAPATIKWASDHTEVADYDYAPTSTFELDLIESTATNVASKTNYTALGKTRILLPQDLEDDDDPTDPTADPIATTTDQKLVVAYTIKTEFTSKLGTWATEDVVTEVRLNNGNIGAWRDNQNITYRISINPYSLIPVTFDPAVVDWTDVFSDDINIAPLED